MKGAEYLRRTESAAQHFFEDLNHNGTFEPENDYVFGAAVQDGLAAGETAEVSIDIDDRVLFRDNLIYAFVDSDSVIPESDETNNTNMIMVTVGDGEPRLLADINGSGRVDGFDLAVLARAFGSNLGQQNFDPAADLVPDETIDGMDLALFMQFFGFEL